jgi:xylan 1,4-beta-xylosidase
MCFGRFLYPIVLVAAFSVGGLAQTAAVTPIVTVQVDAGHTSGPYTPVWNYFGADEPNYSYATNGQQLLRQLSQLSPAPVYVRLHNLLTSGDGSASLKWGSTNAYREDSEGKPIYDWTITDRIFDALTKNGVTPLVEVGFMPEALSTRPQPYRHSFPDGSVFTGWSYPPKDYEKWAALIKAWTQHLHERYGDATENTWLWEVWNEPDIDYWHGTPEQYDQLYDLTAAAIQKVLPGAKIGGPEVTGVGPGKSENFLRQFWNTAHGVKTPQLARSVRLWLLSAFIRRARHNLWMGTCEWILDASCVRWTLGCAWWPRIRSGRIRLSFWGKAIRRVAPRARARRTVIAMGRSMG